MRNPFEYGGVVSGDAFCNREKEIRDLLRAMENAEKLFVFSERRYGKTSLVRAALGRLPKKAYVCAYVDLWPTDSEALSPFDSAGKCRLVKRPRQLQTGSR